VAVQSTSPSGATATRGSRVVWASEAVNAPFPKRVGVALARLAERPPRGGDWVHEVKFDGYRLAARLEGGEARLLTRNGLDWTDRFPSVAQALEELDVESALLDGELIALGADGRPDFGALQRAAQPRSPRPRATGHASPTSSSTSSTWMAATTAPRR